VATLAVLPALLVAITCDRDVETPSSDAGRVEPDAVLEGAGVG